MMSCYEQKIATMEERYSRIHDLLVKLRGEMKETTSLLTRMTTTLSETKEEVVADHHRGDPRSSFVRADHRIATAGGRSARPRVRRAGAPGPSPRLRILGLHHHRDLHELRHVCAPQRLRSPHPRPGLLRMQRGCRCPRLLAHDVGVYITCDSATYRRNRLPRHWCDHHAYGNTPEDGIGPFVAGAVQQVMESTRALVCFETYKVHGDMPTVPAEVLDSICHNKVYLKGGLATPVGGSVSSLDNVQQFVDNIQRAGMPLDVLFCNTNIAATSTIIYAMPRYSSSCLSTMCSIECQSSFVNITSAVVHTIAKEVTKVPVQAPVASECSDISTVGIGTVISNKLDTTLDFELLPVLLVVQPPVVEQLWPTLMQFQNKKDGYVLRPAPWPSLSCFETEEHPMLLLHQFGTSNHESSQSNAVVVQVFSHSIGLTFSKMVIPLLERWWKMIANDSTSVLDSNSLSKSAAYNSEKTLVLMRSEVVSPTEIVKAYTAHSMDFSLSEYSDSKKTFQFYTVRASCGVIHSGDLEFSLSNGNLVEYELCAAHYQLPNCVLLGITTSWSVHEKLQACVLDGVLLQSELSGKALSLSVRASNRTRAVSEGCGKQADMKDLMKVHFIFLTYECRVDDDTSAYHSIQPVADALQPKPPSWVWTMVAADWVLRHYGEVVHCSVLMQTVWLSFGEIQTRLWLSVNCAFAELARIPGVDRLYFTVHNMSRAASKIAERSANVSCHLTTLKMKQGVILHREGCTRVGLKIAESEFLLGRREEDAWHCLGIHNVDPWKNEIVYRVMDFLVLLFRHAVAYWIPHFHIKQLALLHQEKVALKLNQEVMIEGSGQLASCDHGYVKMLSKKFFPSAWGQAESQEGRNVMYWQWAMLRDIGPSRPGLDWVKQWAVRHRKGRAPAANGDSEERKTSSRSPSSTSSFDLLLCNP